MDRRIPYVSLGQRRNLFVDHFQKSWLIILFGLILAIAGIFVLLNNEVRQKRLKREMKRMPSNNEIIGFFYTNFGLAFIMFVILLWPVFHGEINGKKI